MEGYGRPRSIFGTRVRVHNTCAVAFLLIAAIVATQLPESYSFWQRAAIGVLTAALFFILLVVRELVISLATGRGSSPVKDVTLFPFGGVCQTSGELPLPGYELLMAAARLLSSVVIAVTMYGVYALSINSGNLTVAGIFEWLAFIWSGLFLVHLFPGFPLDAGMALRALLLKRSGDYHQATHTASTVGWAAGLIVIFCGITLFVITHQWHVGLVIATFGWLLSSASATVRNLATLLISLEPVIVRDVMTAEYVTIDHNLTIAQLYRDYILVSGWDYYVVVDGKAIKGVLTEKSIKAVSWRRWDGTRAGDIMTRLSEIEPVYPMQTADEALQAIDRAGMDFMPVLDDGRVVGVISRERLVRLGKTRAGSGV